MKLSDGSIQSNPLSPKMKLTYQKFQECFSWYENVTTISGLETVTTQFTHSGSEIFAEIALIKMYKMFNNPSAKIRHLSPPSLNT